MDGAGFTDVRAPFIWDTEDGEGEEKGTPKQMVWTGLICHAA